MAKVRRLLFDVPTQDRSFEPIREWLAGGSFGGSRSSTGKSISPVSAMHTAPVFGCVRLISGIVSALPMSTYTEEIPEVRIPYRPTPEWMKFNQGPWNRTTVMQTGLVSCLLEGNTYFATERDRMGTIQSIRPLDPTKVEPFESSSQNFMRYRVTTPAGTVTAEPWDILHIPGMMMPGDIKGMSVVAYARETIGLSMGLDEYGASLLKNDARPSMGLEIPGELSQTGVDVIRNSWNDIHQGAGNSGKLAVMTEGAKFRNLSINPDDAQFLETKKVQTPQTCMFFGVPPARLGYADAPMLGSSLAEQNTTFVQDTIAGWVNRFEDGLSDAQRMSGDTPDDVKVGLSLNAYMRGDYVSRITTNVMAVREGIFSPNEAREQEGKPPAPWGDRPISVQVQGNADDSEGS